MLSPSPALSCPMSPTEALLNLRRTAGRLKWSAQLRHVLWVPLRRLASSSGRVKTQDFVLISRQGSRQRILRAPHTGAVLRVQTEARDNGGSHARSPRHWTTQCFSTITFKWRARATLKARSYKKAMEGVDVWKSGRTSFTPVYSLGHGARRWSCMC